MILGSGSAKLQYAIKTLNMKWDEIHADWNDPVSMEFEENRLKPLQEQVASTLKAMDRLAEVLHRAQQECS